MKTSQSHHFDRGYGHGRAGHQYEPGPGLSNADRQEYYHGYNVARFERGIWHPLDVVIHFEGRLHGSIGIFYPVKLFNEGERVDRDRAIEIANENGYEVRWIREIEDTFRGQRVT